MDTNGGKNQDEPQMDADNVGFDGGHSKAPGYRFLHELIHFFVRIRGDRTIQGPTLVKFP
jgi:hypothetical protein